MFSYNIPDTQSTFCVLLPLTKKWKSAVFLNIHTHSWTVPLASSLIWWGRQGFLQQLHPGKSPKSFLSQQVGPSPCRFLWTFCFSIWKQFFLDPSRTWASCWSEIYSWVFRYILWSAGHLWQWRSGLVHRNLTVLLSVCLLSVSVCPVFIGIGWIEWPWVGNLHIVTV